MKQRRGEEQMENDKMLIPKVFHRIWIGSKPMPQEFIEYGETWKKHHPDWEMKLWTDENMIVLQNQDAYNNALHFAQKADLARYEILYRFGGVYIDCDFECVRSIEELLKGIEAFAASEDGCTISIGIMGCVPQNEIFKVIIENVPAWMKAFSMLPISGQTGPWFVTNLLRGNKKLKIFEKEKFYPYYYTEKYKKGEVFKDAYAIHHWAASWWT
ncbi:MAG: hypothetical protein K0S71_2479 [Clostridia bacterium]|jgi:mannosyltransferase OCH1-like enzyme|nr:hypothetical protein [Clostridia bacterium]